MIRKQMVQPLETDGCSFEDGNVPMLRSSMHMHPTLT